MESKNGGGLGMRLAPLHTKVGKWRGDSSFLLPYGHCKGGGVAWGGGVSIMLAWCGAFPLCDHQRWSKERLKLTKPHTIDRQLSFDLCYVHC